MYVAPPFTKADTLELEDAAELMRASHARLVEAKAGIRAWRVAGAVWGLTVPYRKGWEAVFVERLELLTGMDNRSVRRGIKEAAQAGALEWEPNRWIPPEGESGRPSLVGLPGAPRSVPQTRMAPPSGLSRPGREEPDSITPKVQRSKALPIETENLGSQETERAKSGAPQSGTPRGWPAWETLPRAELERRAFQALNAGDTERLEAIRDELHRRDAASSALARFGES